MNQVPWLNDLGLNDLGRDFTSAFSASGATGSAGALIAAHVPASGFSFNVATGQDASGNIQTAGGLADANWTVTNADNYKQAPIAFTTAPGNVDWFTGGPGNLGWFANGPGSSWICANPDNAANGAMTLTLTFNLAGFNPADAMLVGGQVAADDNATVTLNGHSLGATGTRGWETFHALSNGAGDFVAGVNTLVIQIGATDNFLEAVRLEGTVVDTVSSGPPGPIHWANAVSADFNTAADWTGGVVPGSTNDAILDAAGTKAYTVTASTGEAVLTVQTAATATLAISSGTFSATNGTGKGVNAGTIQINNGATLAAGGSVANSGTIAVASAGTGAALVITGATTLSGAGKVTMSDQLGNQIAGGASAATLTNVNNTISGAGTIGSSTLTLANKSAGIIDATGVNGLILNTGSNTITNAGLIEATGAGGLAIDSAVANTGTLTALGAGALTLQNATVTNTGGAVSAGAGGHVSLEGETIAGGAVTVAAGGLLSADGGNSTLTPASFTNAGTVSVGNGASLAVGGAITNSGTIAVASTGTGGATSLVITGATTLSGAGKVTMSDQLGNQIIGGASAATLTNVNNTISGAGTIGSSTLTLANKSAGIIDATGVNGLILDTGSNTITNAGLIEATGAGGLAIDSVVANTGTLTALGAGALTLQNALVTNTGGAVSAGAGGHVSLEGETIAGGAVTVAAGGLLSADGGNSALTPASFINAGTASVGDGASLAVVGAITNSGTIAVVSTGSRRATLLWITGATTLSGAGKVTLSDESYNAIAGGAPGATLTNVNNTLSGAGTISSLTLVNESAGIIDATGVNGLILNTGSNTITNAGLIEATGAGGMTIEGTVANAGGMISVGAGSHIDLLGADVMGGTLETATDRAIRIKAGAASVLDGTASAINDQALIIVAIQAALTIEGSITNTKGIRLVSGTAHSPTLTIGAAGVTLSGGGHIAMDNSAGNLITGASSAATLTNVDNFITGAGRLGGGQLALVNEATGVIVGNQATALIIDTGASTIVNAGVIVTRGAGGMTITSAVANSGRLEAVGSVMTLDGAVSGSGFAIIAGGAIDFASAFSENVAFRGGTGVLGLAQSQSYGGTINGFSATGGTALDLGDIAFVGAGEATFSGKFSGGVLTVSDGTHTASLSLRGNFLQTTFTASSDGHGGTMVVASTPAAAAAPAHRFVAAMAALAAPGGAAVHLGDAAAFHPPALARPHVMAA